MAYSLRLIEDHLAAHAAAPVPAIGPAGTWLYRAELFRQPPPPAGGRGRLEHPVDLANLRCDRKDFDPGGSTPPHRHPVETSFIRFSTQPARIRGQSSILDVDPADAGRGRPRRYTVYVDEPIRL